MDTRELIERLRKGQLSYMLDSGGVYHGGDALHLEAASALASQAAEIERLRDALKPSADTKASYIGEFSFMVDDLGVDEDGDTFECQREITVPWTTIKEIMAAISARTALSGDKS